MRIWIHCRVYRSCPVSGSRISAGRTVLTSPASFIFFRFSSSFFFFFKSFKGLIAETLLSGPCSVAPCFSRFRGLFPPPPGLCEPWSCGKFFVSAVSRKNGQKSSPKSHPHTSDYAGRRSLLNTAPTLAALSARLPWAFLNPSPPSCVCSFLPGDDGLPPGDAPPVLSK